MKIGLQLLLADGGSELSAFTLLGVDLVLVAHDTAAPLGQRLVGSIVVRRTDVGDELLQLVDILGSDVGQGDSGGGCRG